MKTRSWLASPYLLGLALLVALPALGALGLAFTDFAGFDTPKFTGTENIERLVGDSAFWRALGNSAMYVVIALPLRMIFAVGFALLLHRRRAGYSAARAIAYLPSVIPDVAYGLLWLWLFNPIYGPLALALGDASPGWLTSPWGARFGVALMGAFQIGEAFVVALAARRAIPSHLYEAATVDGASPWFITKRVTLPMMAPVLAILALRDVTLSLQANFVPAFIVTDGGPYYATTYLPLYVYQQGFGYFRLGYAAMMTLSMFVITALAVFVAYRLARRWRYA